VAILTSSSRTGSSTYMVAMLRTHGALPLWCNGPARYWLRRSGTGHCPGCALAGWVWGEWKQLGSRVWRLSVAALASNGE
jgi:hypothetical protein